MVGLNSISIFVHIPNCCSYQSQMSRRIKLERNNETKTFSHKIDSKDDTRTSANPDTKRELHSALQEILDIAEKLEAAADDVIGGKKS